MKARIGHDDWHVGPYRQEPGRTLPSLPWGPDEAEMGYPVGARSQILRAQNAGAQTRARGEHRN